MLLYYIKEKAKFFALTVSFFKTFHYLCHRIQAEIVHVSESRLLLLYESLDFSLSPHSLFPCAMPSDHKAITIGAEAANTRCHHFATLPTKARPISD